MGSLGLDLRHAPGEILQLARRVERLQPFEEALQGVELLPVLVPILAGYQFAVPAGQAGLDVLGDRDDLLGQFVGLRAELLDRLLVGVRVADQPLGQPQQIEQGDQLSQGQPLGLFDVLEGEQLLQGRLPGFAQVGGVESLAGYAEGDVAVLHQRQQDDQ